MTDDPRTPRQDDVTHLHHPEPEDIGVVEVNGTQAFGLPGDHGWVGDAADAVTTDGPAAKARVKRGGTHIDLRMTLEADPHS